MCLQEANRVGHEHDAAGGKRSSHVMNFEQELHRLYEIVSMLAESAMQQKSWSRCAMKVL